MKRSVRELNDIEREELLDIGMKKKNGQLNLTWAEIADMFELVDGEKVRGFINKYRQTIGDLKDYSQFTNERVLILSDFHIPFHDKSFILKTVKENQVDTIIVAGDVIDGLCLSTHGNVETPQDLLSEVIEAHSLFKEIRALTDAKIYVIHGNHEIGRWNRFIAKRSLQCLSGLLVNPIDAICNGFTIGVGEDKQIYGGIPNCEYIGKNSMVYRDVLVLHPDIYRKNSLATVQAILKERVKWKYPHVRAVFAGHTHALCTGIYQDILIGETGCCCKAQDYADNDGRLFSITSLGAITFTITNGAIDYNTARIIYGGIPE